MTKPLPIVLGTGRLADEARARIAQDPDRYRHETWSLEPVGACACCGERVFAATTRRTGWAPGYQTHSGLVHPRVDSEGELDGEGDYAGCCCGSGCYGLRKGLRRRLGGVER